MRGVRRVHAILSKWCSKWRCGSRGPGRIRGPHRMVTWLMSSRERMERGSSSRYIWAMMALLHHNDCLYGNLADELAGEDGEGQQQQARTRSRDKRVQPHEQTEPPYQAQSGCVQPSDELKELFNQPASPPASQPACLCSAMQPASQPACLCSAMQHAPLSRPVSGEQCWPTRLRTQTRGQGSERRFTPECIVEHESRQPTSVWSPPTVKWCAPLGASPCISALAWMSSRSSSPRYPPRERCLACSHIKSWSQTSVSSHIKSRNHVPPRLSSREAPARPGTPG
jgi:hypothetical protein